MAAPKRLNKVAREFNVGISTIVEFLASIGKEVETNPNTKIDSDLYDLLVDEFQAEKKAKEESKSVLEKEERIAISITPKEVKEEDPVEEVKLPEPIQPEQIPAPAAEKEKKTRPSVIGKIDLSAVNQRTRPVKKAKQEPKPEPKKPIAKKEQPKKVEQPKLVKQEEKKPKEATPPPQIETIKARSEKLTGPKVLGKIELPKEQVRSKSSDDDNKRKRKRIKKVNVEKAGQRATREHKKANKKTVKKQEISPDEINKEIKETLARLSGGGKSKGARNRRAKRDAQAERREMEAMEQAEQETVLKLTEFVTVSELASMMNKSATDIIGACMSLGIFASINQRLDAETIVIIAEEYGYTVEFIKAQEQDEIEIEEDKPEDLLPRCPIVTVMGHVDHGKTSLLDYIREAKVTEGEAGGITQHIGAYNVTGESGQKITFLDTPGHEAFTAMRARGAQVTDVAIIIIAADDDVMPQTKEAINHAQAAGVPMIFAFNKCDKPDANPDRIKEQLSQMNILVEDWGGKFQCQEVSAKTGKGIDELLEKVLLEAELLELKANPNKRALGTIIESTLDKGRGYVTTLLVEAGTLKIGDVLLAGTQYGKVKAMHNERGEAVNEVGPSMPVSILGMNGAVTAGDHFNVMEDEKEVKAISARRQQLQREQTVRTQKHITIEEIGRRIAVGDFQELNVIVKGDVDGSIEALSDSLLKLSTEQIEVKIIHKAVGQISESDVLLATASDAIIVGFQVRPSANAKKLAEKEGIDIRLYSVIYKAIEEIKDAMEGMLAPEMVEEITGTAEVRETFKITKVGTIAGCYVHDGKLVRNNKVRVIREGIVIYAGELGSLKRFKDDVKEVTHNYECGLNIDKFNDIKVGDHIESYHEVEVARKLK